MYELFLNYCCLRFAASDNSFDFSHLLNVDNIYDVEFFSV